MKKLATISAAVLALAALAHEVRAASPWTDMGESNGVEVFKFSDGAGRTCFVTVPQGGISCLK